jgi:hypothetical protein
LFKIQRLTLVKCSKLLISLGSGQPDRLALKKLAQLNKEKNGQKPMGKGWWYPDKFLKTLQRNARVSRWVVGLKFCGLIEKQNLILYPQKKMKIRLACCSLQQTPRVEQHFEIRNGFFVVNFFLCILIICGGKAHIVVLERSSNFWSCARCQNRHCSETW